MTLRLDAAEATKVAQSHDAAADAIDGAATSAPAAVDGGYGTGYLMDILAAVSQTAGELSVVNRGIGMQVRDTADDIQAPPAVPPSVVEAGSPQEAERDKAIAETASDTWQGATEMASDTWEGATEMASITWDAVTPW